MQSHMRFGVFSKKSPILAGRQSVKIKNYYLLGGHPLHIKSKSNLNQKNQIFYIFSKKS